MHDSLVHVSTCSSPLNWHSNLLAFDEEPLGTQHSNLDVRERNTLLSRTMPWRDTLEVLCNVHAATFKFRNRVVCLFRKLTFINEATN